VAHQHLDKRRNRRGAAGARDEIELFVGRVGAVDVGGVGPQQAKGLQFEARDKGRPWDWGKSFDNSAVCGPIRKAAEIGRLAKGFIRLSVNGAMRQNADLSDLIWSVPEIVSILSRAVRLWPGDLVFTGTPAGVGALVPGDVCIVEIEGLGSLTTTIGEAAA
jgi:fumarylpyruvate hydrolase